MAKPDESLWFDWTFYVQSAVFGAVGVAGLMGNAAVMWLSSTAVSLKTVPACRLIFSLAFWDLVFSLFFIAEIGAVCVPDSMLCSVVGYIAPVIVIISVHFPPLIAYCRYVQLCHLGSAGIALSHFSKKFSIRNVFIINVVICGYVACMFAPFPLSGRVGFHESGMCFTKYSDSIYMSIYFYLISLTTIFLTYALVVVFYRKISRWVLGKQSLVTTPSYPYIERIINENKSFLRMVRGICIIPVVVLSPGILLFIVMSFYKLSYWPVRLSSCLWSTICVLDPCVTLLVNEQYKRALVASKLYKFIPVKLKLLNVVYPKVAVRKVIPSNRTQKPAVRTEAAEHRAEAGCNASPISKH